MIERIWQLRRGSRTRLGVGVKNDAAHFAGLQCDSELEKRFERGQAAAGDLYRYLSIYRLPTTTTGNTWPPPLDVAIISSDSEKLFTSSRLDSRRLDGSLRALPYATIETALCNASKRLVYQSVNRAVHSNLQQLERGPARRPVQSSPVRVTLRGHFLAAALVHELADTGRLLYLKADCTPRSTFLPVSERLTLVRNSQLQCHESLETGDWHLTRIKILRRVFDVPSLLQDLPYNIDNFDALVPKSVTASVLKIPLSTVTGKQ
ncbi:hypothetical protein BJV77DRAFT_960234 [Russula vinacea]|nr:hypothetical protein BJV77DRAFT_960234 [Russula vinacea]